MLANLFSLTGPSALLIFGIVLLLFGGKKLPEFAKSAAAALKEFRRGQDEADKKPSEEAPQKSVEEKRP
jgi:sec-independent protein translocase protein TatA